MVEKPSAKPVIRLTLDLDPELHEKVRLEAEKRGIAVVEVIREKLRRRVPKRPFDAPTITDVKGYAVTMSVVDGLKLDPHKFFDFYESKGWKVGNQPMKDWKAAARRAAREWATLPQEATKAPEAPSGPSQATKALWEAQERVRVENAESERLRKERGLK